jgi:SHOCT-like domain
MQQQTISVEQTIKVQVNSVTGDLRVAGWDRAEIMAKTDGDRLDLTVEGGEAHVACDEDLILYLPRPVTLVIESVAGDASLQALHGPLRLGPVAGDLTMNDVGPVDAETVAGDASLRNVGAMSAKSISGDFTLRVGNGPCAIETIGGDASIRDVNGELSLQNVGSDLYVRNVHGSVNVNAGADIALYLEPLPGQLYNATAGDDILVRIPRDVNIELHLVGGDAEDVHVDVPGVELSGDSTAYDLTIGPPAENIAKMYLTAGDELLVTCRSDAWESAADFGKGMADGSNWGIPPIPPLPPDFSERINRRVQAAMERAQAHIEEASRRSEAAGRRAGIKVEAAVRRAEAKARAAEVRARRGAHFNMNVGRWEWDLTPTGPVETEQPVSDEERLAILRMLQEKKITLEDAEQLLAALEGK